MAQRNDFKLENFLPDSLSLQVNIVSPTRNIFRLKEKDPYAELTSQDPLKVLGEIDFFPQEKVPKEVVGTPIQEFYRDANVMITGATGFVGKALTEKLVRSIPHLGHVYLLIRPKKGKDAKERLDKLLEDKVFRRMRTEVPWYLSKITAIEGDISQPELGLSAVDRRLLTDKVHVVFHSAADVKFFEPLNLAIEANLLGSRRVMEFSRGIKNLKSFLHVSTAYSQCVRRVIEENIPRSSINYKELVKYVTVTDQKKVMEDTPKILQGWPNTYTFSKALTEVMIQEEGGDLPICIFRPSVVLSTYREPVRGWTDNLYGPVGLFVGTGHGIIHCVRIDGDLYLDTVPVDYVVNGMIAASWRTATVPRVAGELPVYNFTSEQFSPNINWKNLSEMIRANNDSWPFSRSVWYPCAFYTDSYLVSEVMSFLLHRVPGVIIDTTSKLTGQPFRLSRLYNKIDSLKGQTRYFSTRKWVFKKDNVRELLSSLNKEDKRIFHFDVVDVDYKEHFLLSRLGIRYFYLKESMDNLPAARRKNTRLYWLHMCFKAACGLATLKLLVLAAHVIPI